MDLNMDDYIDPYEEAEAVAAGLGGPAAVDYDDPNSEAASSGRGNHRVRNPDTFRCPWKKKQNYKLKDLQHVDGIGVSIKRQRREHAVHRAFARFVRMDPSFTQELARNRSGE